jgi:hypothetical protein
MRGFLWEFLVASANLIDDRNPDAAYILRAVAGCSHNNAEMTELKTVVQKWVRENSERKP